MTITKISYIIILKNYRNGRSRWNMNYPRTFAYYEDGKKQLLSIRDTYRMFRIMVNDEQKFQGTTYQSWMDEMQKFQILNKL